MRFEQSFLDNILQTAILSEIIGERISIKKKSGGYIAICPFHNDTKPSLHISDQKQIFKCFACGKGGNAFSFIMEFEHKSFSEAVRIISEKYNIQLPKDHNNLYYDHDKYLKLKEINKYAFELYNNNLFKEKSAQDARKYLASRNIHAAISKEFMLGYAPNSFDYLTDHLFKKFDSEDIKNTGLLYEKQETGKIFDFFRNRIMFPICNERDEIIGFGGRILGQGEPKYLNTRETALFQKKYSLYGLNKAYSFIVQHKEAIIVEGYMDVIACHKHNIKTAVAPNGTSLTQEQIIKLKRYTGNITLLFDGDSAGIKAALRSSILLIENNINGSVLTLPEGQDPFDFLEENGREYFIKYKSENQQNIYDFFINNHLPEREISPAEKNEIYTNNFIPVLKNIKNDIIFEEFHKQIASALQININVLNKQFEKQIKHTTYQPNKIINKSDNTTETKLNKYRRKTEIDLMLFLCENPKFIQNAFFTINPDELIDESAKYIYKNLLQLMDQENINCSQILNQMINEEIKSFITRKLLSDNKYKYKPEVQLNEYLFKIKKNILDKKIKSIKEKLHDACDKNNHELTAKLLEDQMVLDNEKIKLYNLIK